MARYHPAMPSNEEPTCSEDGAAHTMKLIEGAMGVDSSGSWGPVWECPDHPEVVKTWGGEAPTEVKRVGHP